MKLTPQETQRFYGIWWPLLHYTNQQRRRVPHLSGRPTNSPLAPGDAASIRDALWADDSLRERFIAENPARLSSADLEIVASWRYRLAGHLYVLRHLKNYTVFLDQGEPARAYGVLGLVSTIEEIIVQPLPALVQAVLLPFDDKITYDGVVVTYRIILGPGIRDSLNLAYRNAKEREGIVTSLLPPAKPPSIEEAWEGTRARNRRILVEFRKCLHRSGLSAETAERHVGNMDAFANTYLLEQDPPRPLQDIDAEDVQAYLASRGLSAREENQAVTGFKRFVRFLLDSERTDLARTRRLENALKSRGVAR